MTTSVTSKETVHHRIRQTIVILKILNAICEMRELLKTEKGATVEPDPTSTEAINYSRRSGSGWSSRSTSRYSRE